MKSVYLDYNARFLQQWDGYFISDITKMPIIASRYGQVHIIKRNIYIASTENTQQSEQTWSNFSNMWLPLCGESKSFTVIVFIDGDTTHITSNFIKQCATHLFYVVVKQSHTSMILQVSDLGIERCLKMRYDTEYTSTICLYIYSNIKRPFDEV